MKNLTHFIVFRILIKKLRVGILFTFLSFILINGFSQSADLIIQKTGPNQVYVGQSMQYTFVITNNGPNDVTNATWNDNLPSGLTNVTFVSCTALGGAVCPSGGSISISNTNFSGTIPFLPVNGTITMVIEMRAPAPANGTSFSNTATVSVPSGVTEVDPTTNTSTWNTTLITKIDISVQKTVTPITSIGCGDLADTLEYTVLWVNNGPSAANGVSILDYIDTRNAVYSGGGNASYSFPYDIFGETWYSSSGTSTPSWQFGQSGLTFTPQGNLQYIGLAGFPNDIAVWEPGDTIRLNYKLAIQAPTISGCGRNLDSFNINNQAYFSIPNTIQLQDTNVNNNNSSVVNRIRLCAAIECPRTDISVQKTVTPITSIGCGDLADTLEYTVLWVNNGPSAANGVSILDYIDTRNAVYSGGGNASYSFPYDIFGETWYSSSGTSTPSWQFGQSGLTFTPQGNLQYIGLAGFPNDIAVWEPGDTIRLNYKLAIQAPTISGCGRNLDSFNINNQAYFSIPNTIQLQDTNVNNNNSSVVNRIRLCAAIECPRTDISVQKTVTPITSIGCGDLADTLEYTVLWVNNGPSAANGVSILDYIDTRNAVYSGGGNASYSFPYDIFGETWYSSSGTSTPSWQFGQSGLTFTPQGNLQYIGLAGFPNDIAVWEPGDTIRLDYKLAIQAPTISGCGRNLDSFNINNQAYFSIPNTTQLQDTNVNNNNSSVVNRIRLLSAIDMSISKSVVPPILNSGDSLTMTIILQNAPGGATANPAVLRDTLPTTFTYVPSTLVCTATGGAICGPVTYNPTTRVLEQINSNMPSNSQIIITFKGPVQSLYTTTQTTSARAYQPCVDCVPATNFTQTNFQILGPCDTVRAGLDGDTIICDNSSSTIDLYSLISGEYGGGTWSRTIGMGGILNAGAGTFTPAIGATTSVFMYIKTGISACPNDTSLATIIINPTYNITLDSNICAGSSVSVCGSVYNTNGTHVKTCTSINGCDSIITLNLIVYPNYNITINATTCDPAQAGTVVQNLTTVDGCDSIITTITTLLPSYNITVNATTCDLAQVGTVVQNFTTIDGCDSIVTTITSLLPSYNITVNATTCDPSQVGTVVQNLTTVDGCDSIVTTITTLLPSYNITVNGTTCDPAQVGTVVQNLTTIDGCDSIVTTITTLLPSFNITVNAITCDPAQSGTVVQNLTTVDGCDSIITTITTLLISHNITINAQTCDPAQAGTVVQNLTTVDGCDSIVTTITTLLPSYNITENAITCDPAQSGTVVQNLTTVDGCDSTVTTITTLLPSYNITLTATTCDPAQAGTTTNTVTAANGCDSVITTITTLLPSSSSTVNATTCDPAQVGTTTNTVTASNGCDSVITTITTLLPSSSSTVNATTCDPAQVGTTTNTVTASNGCDSVITTITTLAPFNTATQNISVCFGGSITVCGNVHNTSGTYVDTCIQTVGCDSIITTNLTVEAQITSTVNATTCDPAQVGTTTQTLVAANGCDSVITTITTLLPSSLSTVNATTCDPANVGTTTQTLTGSNGCDSIVTTITTLLPSSSSTVNATTCDPAQVGTVVQNLTTVDGCDSIITTIITLLPSYNITLNATTCNPAQAGTVVQNLTAVDGCDSIVTTNTTLLPSFDITLNATTCDPAQVGTVVQNLTTVEGCDSIVTTITTLLPSFNITVNAQTCDPAQAGTVVQNLTTVDGCDSTVTTITTLLPSYNITLTATTCDPAQAGTAVQNFTTVDGCDSIVTTNTTLLPSFDITLNATTCDPAQAGTVVQNLTTVDGCDSTVTTITTLLPSYNITLTATTCDPAQVGTVVQNLTTVDGCDSIITTITALLPSFNITVNAQTCDPAQVGTVVQNLTTVDGCDSTVTTITTLVSTIRTTVNLSSCNPADTGTVIQTFTSQQGCDSIVTTITTLLPSFDITLNATTCDPAQAGTVVQNLTTVDGCDSTVTTITTLLPSYNITLNATTCNPAQAGTVVQNLTAVDGCDSIVTTNTTLLPSFDITLNATTCDPAQAGTIVQNLTTVDGCDSTVTTITTLYSPVSVSNIATTCATSGLNYWVSFEINGTGPFTVTGGLGSISGNIFTSNPIAVNTGYNFTVSDVNNCNNLAVSGVAPNCVIPCTTPNCGKVKVRKN